MLKIAIVGNIASGKTETEKIISELGYNVLDTDKIAHKLLENNQKIMCAFENSDILEDGKISRIKLGKIVFSDEEKRKTLENILHPEIKEEIVKFFSKNITEKMVFVSIPLLFEANMQDLFDKIIFIYSDDEIRLKRLIARNSYTREYAKIRMSAQLPQEEKINKSDIVIYNNSTLEELKENIKSKLSVL